MKRVGVIVVILCVAGVVAAAIFYWDNLRGVEFVVQSSLRVKSNLIRVKTSQLNDAV